MGEGELKKKKKNLRTLQRIVLKFHFRFIPLVVNDKQTDGRTVIYYITTICLGLVNYRYSPLHSHSRKKELTLVTIWNEHIPALKNRETAITNTLTNSIKEIAKS